MQETSLAAVSPDELVRPTVVTDIAEAYEEALVEAEGRTTLELKFGNDVEARREYENQYYRITLEDGRTFEGNGRQAMGKCKYLGGISVKALKVVLDDVRIHDRQPPERVPHANLVN